MSKHEQINFSEFYINEFFDQVRDKTKPTYPDADYKLIDELFTLLSKQQEITDGIGKLAEQQASSELSIFLFDIFDRAQDYPPTELIDALPEIADDFVSGLTMMMEDEEQIIKSIENVIIGLRGEAPAKPVADIKEIKEEIPQEPEKVENIPASKKAPEAKEKNLYNFMEFVELEFFDQFHKALEIQQSDKESKAKLAYNRLVLEELSDLTGPDTPANLGRFVSILGLIFPWRLGQNFTASELIKHLPEWTDDCVKAIGEIDTEDIRNTINEGKLIYKKAEKESQFQREEISVKPTTIDKLLSDYFQSEADEQIKKIRKIISDLGKQPDSPEKIKQLLETLHSFKEISMIHGYVLLEDFCYEMIAYLNQAIKEKKVFNQAMVPASEQLLEILTNTDKLKDARVKTSEVVQFQKIQEEFLASLFVSKLKQTDKKESEKKAVVTGKKETEVSAKDQAGLINVLKSLLRDLKPVFKQTLPNDRSDPEKLLPLLAKLKGAAGTIGNLEILRFFDEYSHCIEGCTSLKGKTAKKARAELMTLYNAFTMKVSPDFKYELYQKRLEKIRDSIPAVDKIVPFGDKAALLKILMENEGCYEKTVMADLEKFLISNDDAARERQIKHFKQLDKNFILDDASVLSAFPKYFLNLLETAEPVAVEKKNIEKLSKAYNNLIRKISENGAGAEIDPLLSEIKTIFTPQMADEPEATKEVVSPGLTEDSSAEENLGELIMESEPNLSGDSGDEEDLDEIFKQESTKYLSIIETALDELKTQPDNPVSFEKIEKSLHSLKSSSRLMGFNDVADLCGPFEKICEKLHTVGQALNPDDMGTFKESLQGLKSGIAGETFDAEPIIKKLKKIRVSEISVQTDAEKDIKTEEQLFADSGDGDEDLLDIFKEESKEYISIVEKANQALSENLTDKEALGQLENSTHSLKTAAKMLGFSEIGQLADSIEVVTVAILKGEIKNHPGVLKEFSEAIRLIKELASGQKQNINQVDKVSVALSINELKENEAAQPQADDQGTLSQKSPELDEQTHLFVKEGWELLEKINRDLLNLEKTPDNTKIITDLNRTIHTLKGSAQILNFKKIGELTHKIEDVFVKARESGTGLHGDQIDVVFKAVDVIQELVKSIKSGNGEENPDVQDVLNQINLVLGEKQTVRQAVAKPVIPEGPLTKPKIVGIESEEEIPTRNDQFIKITTENLDKLINMAAELVINKTQLNSYLDKLRKIGETIEDDKKRLRKTDHTINSFLENTRSGENPDPTSLKIDPNLLNDLIASTDDFKDVLNTFDAVASSFRAITRDFEQNIGQISSLSKSLHDDILQVRLVPTELLFNRFPRAVRDMAKKLNKKINLVVEGEQTEMDRALIESLTDPVMHLVRNAIDHGIETPDERTEQGKSEDGILLLKARRSKNQIIIDVQDDGRGIDPVKVREEIVKKGLANKQDADQMTISEVMDHVFKPGFSTRKEASDISGRGVGLDVVANQIQKLKGDIKLSSTSGKGTIFSIRVPLTLAIAQAIMVNVGKEVLAIPLSAVEETVQFKDPELVEKDERAFITVRDQLIPVAYLSSLLDYGDEAQPSDEPHKTAIIVREAGSMYGLIVDKVLGREEIVIKSLGEELSSIPYISGGTVSGDGSVILILDIPSLTQKIKSDVDEPEEDFSAIERARKIITEDSKKGKLKKPAKKKGPIKPTSTIIREKKVSGRKPVALIVDDSVSVRKFVSSVLEKNGYATILAEDGPEALQELEKNEFDIIITDLEMPKMQGFDLIAEIRRHRKFESIPIIILTGRAGKKHKDKGTELGANAYITKPFKESDLLNTLEDFITIK